MKAELLYVIGTYYNPRRQPWRASLARQWVADNLDCGVNVTLVEHAFGERPYEFSKDEKNFDKINLVQIRGAQQYEIWLSYALLNYGAAHLPESAKYVCFQDADIKHLDSKYGAETVHMLQHHAVGQTWTNSIDLGPTGNVMPNEWGNLADRSFSAAFVAGDVVDSNGGYLPPRALLKGKPDVRDTRSHPGYSWAMRRSVLMGGVGHNPGIGKLVDWDIMGSADYHMAVAYAGILDTTKFGYPVSPGYARRWNEFARLCESTVKQDIGVVDGTLVAGYHGPKAKRLYISRAEVLAESNFDPDTDIAYDVHGLPYLCSDKRALRDGIRRYNKLRDDLVLG